MDGYIKKCRVTWWPHDALTHLLTHARLRRPPFLPIHDKITRTIDNVFLSFFLLRGHLNFPWWRFSCYWRRDALRIVTKWIERWGISRRERERKSSEALCVCVLTRARHPHYNLSLNNNNNNMETHTHTHRCARIERVRWSRHRQAPSNGISFHYSPDDDDAVASDDRSSLNVALPTDRPTDPAPWKSHLWWHGDKRRRRASFTRYVNHQIHHSLSLSLPLNTHNTLLF